MQIIHQFKCNGSILMAIFMPMIKTDEDDEFVSYIFYPDVRDKEERPSKSRKAIGFCTFNKKTLDCILDKNRSNRGLI